MSSAHDPDREAALEELTGFREEFYGCLEEFYDCLMTRADVLFELADGAPRGVGVRMEVRDRPSLLGLGGHGEPTTRGPLPVIEGTVIRPQVDHLPGGNDPKPVWLWCSTVDMAETDVDRHWQTFLRRLDIEHTFRLFKQTLGWTVPKLRDPAAADRWTLLVIVVHTPLRLTRPPTSGGPGRSRSRIRSPHNATTWDASSRPARHTSARPTHKKGTKARRTG